MIDPEKRITNIYFPLDWLLESRTNDNEHTVSEIMTSKYYYPLKGAKT